MAKEAVEDLQEEFETHHNHRIPAVKVIPTNRRRKHYQIVFIIWDQPSKQLTLRQLQIFSSTNHIKKMFNFGNDIGMSLETLEDYNMDQHGPKLQTSDSVNRETKELENKQNEIEFKAEFDAFMKQKNKQKQTLETNTTKVYAFLWEQCAKAMQIKIESNSNYKGGIKGNPIELLKVIKQHALKYHKH
jgi:hypothetical protein